MSETALYYLWPGRIVDLLIAFALLCSIFWSFWVAKQAAWCGDWLLDWFARKFGGGR